MHKLEAVENARRVHPEIEVLRVSCLAGNGLHEWLAWLERRRRTFLAEVEQTVA